MPDTSEALRAAVDAFLAELGGRRAVLVVVLGEEGHVSCMGAGEDASASVRAWVSELVRVALGGPR